MSERDDLADLRVWRDEFAQKHGYDLTKMVAALSEMDRAAGDRVISGVPRTPISAEIASSNRKLSSQMQQPTVAK